MGLTDKLWGKKSSNGSTNDKVSSIVSADDVKIEDVDHKNGTKNAQEPAKKGFGFGLFKKKSSEEIPIQAPKETMSEDVFSGPRSRKKTMDLQDKKTKKGKKSKSDVNSNLPVDDFVRIKVWVRRNRNEAFQPAKFCDCLVDYFASADQRNIYSAPSIQLTHQSQLLQIPHSQVKNSGEIDSQSLDLSSGTLSPFFGCCSSGRSSASMIPGTAESSSSRNEAIIVSVECILQDNRVLMQPAPKDEPIDRHQGRMRRTRRPCSQVSYVAVMEHPSFCCAHRISPKDYKGLPDDSKKRGVDVGVSVLLESSDNRILVTRRAQNMRTFPGVWVPPGGHIDDGETILEAGLREVFEETGLSLKKGKGLKSVVLSLPGDHTDTSNSDSDDEEENEDSDINKYRLLGLWESCFPPVLYAGLPKRQHLVYYLHILVDQSSDAIQQHLKLERSEVGASAWLNRSHAEVIAYSSRPLPESPVPISILDPDTDEITEGVMDPKVLRKKMPEPTREIERLTTGTRFALKLWLCSKEENDDDLRSIKTMATAEPHDSDV